MISGNPDYFIVKETVACLGGAKEAQWVKRWPSDLAVLGLSPAPSEIFSTINRVPLPTAFHYPYPIILI